MGGKRMGKVRLLLEAATKTNLIIYPLAPIYNSMIYYSGLSKIGAIIAQLVEHFLGKEEVGSSILLDGSICVTGTNESNSQETIENG